MIFGDPCKSELLLKPIHRKSEMVFVVGDRLFDVSDGDLGNRAGKLRFQWRLLGYREASAVRSQYAPPDWPTRYVVDSLGTVAEGTKAIVSLPLGGSVGLNAIPPCAYSKVSPRPTGSTTALAIVFPKSADAVWSKARRLSSLVRPQ